MACMVAGSTAAITSYNSEIYADDSDAIEVVFGPEDGVSADPVEADESDGTSKSGEAEGSEDGGKMSSDSASGKGSDHSASGKSSAKKTGRLIDHVKGIRDFSLIEGMVPDPMAGISWDDTIGTVLCDTTKIDWGEIGTHDLTYTIAAMDQTIEFETIKVTIYEHLEHYIYEMKGEEKVTVGGT